MLCRNPSTYDQNFHHRYPQNNNDVEENVKTNETNPN